MAGPLPRCQEQAMMSAGRSKTSVAWRRCSPAGPALIAGAQPPAGNGRPDPDADVSHDIKPPGGTRRRTRAPINMPPRRSATCGCIDFGNPAACLQARGFAAAPRDGRLFRSLRADVRSCGRQTVARAGYAKPTMVRVPAGRADSSGPAGRARQPPVASLSAAGQPVPSAATRRSTPLAVPPRTGRSPPVARSSVPARTSR
jgi:hypothetical protein